MDSSGRRPSQHPQSPERPLGFPSVANIIRSGIDTIRGPMNPPYESQPPQKSVYSSQQGPEHGITRPYVDCSSGNPGQFSDLTRHQSAGQSKQGIDNTPGSSEIHATLVALQRKLHEERGYCQMLEASNRKAKDKIKSKQEEIDRLNQQMQRVQEQAFRRLEDTDWRPLSNNEIEKKLNMLEINVRKLSRSHAVPTLSLSQEPDTKQALQKTLKHVVQEESTLLMTDKPWLLLQAWLMDRIYLDVFETPFFGIPERPQGDFSRREWEKDANLAVSISSNFERTYDEFTQGNFAAAVEWRVKTLRLLRPSIGKQTQVVSQLNESDERTLAGRDAAVASLAAGYLVSGIAPLLDDKKLVDLKDWLIQVLVEATDQSFLLWSQRFDYRVKGIRELEPTFHHDNPYMEAHSLHNRVLDDDPEALDGQPVLLVTHPGLIRLGDHEGSGFSVETVLKKAVCYIREPVRAMQEMHER